MIVANRNIHEHRATCLEGLNGCTGCRMIYPRPHGIPESRLVELTKCIPSAPGSNEAQDHNACRKVNASAAKACHAENISTYGVRIATRMGQCRMTH